jgi:hypothetical protein
MKQLICTMLVVVVAAWTLPAHAADEAKRIRVVLIDGQNNHDWRTTSPWLKKILEGDGKYTVDVSSYLKAATSRARSRRPCRFRRTCRSTTW